MHNLFGKGKRPGADISLSQRKRKVFYYLMIAFPLLQFAVFYLGVNLNSVLLAFKDYDYYTGYRFAGLSNFARVFEDIKTLPYMRTAFVNSFILYGLNLLIVTALSLLFSFYIYKKRFLSGTFKIALFLPVIISNLALVVAYKFFVEVAVPNFVELVFKNRIEGLLTNSGTHLDTILFFNVWVGFGIQVLMYSGAMSGVSESVVEAAQLDGITPFKEFIKITLPLIAPTVSTFVVVGVAQLFLNQMHVFSFHGAGAEYRVYTIGYYLYSRISSQNTTIVQYPYLSAYGLVLTFVSVPLTLGIKKLLEKLTPKQ